MPEGLTRRGKTLNDGQWQAVTGLLNSRNRVNLVEGPAGAGKSSLLAKYDEAMRRAGADRDLPGHHGEGGGGAAEGGFAAETVARFLLDEKMQAAAGGGRVVVDEASMLGHKDAVPAASRPPETIDLKLTFVGDPMQHGAVPRGAFLHVLKEYGGIRPFQPDRDPAPGRPARYRGGGRAALRGRDRRRLRARSTPGLGREIGDGEDRVRRSRRSICRPWPTGQDPAWSCRPRTREASSITASDPRPAPPGRQARGGGARIHPAGAGGHQRGRARAWPPPTGRATSSSSTRTPSGFTKGERLTVTDPAAVPLEHAAKFSLYRPEAIELAEGDVHPVHGHGQDAGRRAQARNGATHTVAGFTPKGNIRLDNGWVVAAIAGHFRHGFVETSFGAQGKTVHVVILGMDSGSVGRDEHGAHVRTASRGRKRMTLYTDDKDAVRRAIERSSAKLVALDLADRKPSPAARLQAEMADAAAAGSSNACGRRGTPATARPRRTSAMADKAVRPAANSIVGGLDSMFQRPSPPPARTRRRSRCPGRRTITGPPDGRPTTASPASTSS